MAAPLAAVLSLATVLCGCTDGPPMDTADGDPTATSGADSTSTSSLSGSGQVEMSTGAFDTAVDSDDTATDSTSGAGFIYGDPDGGNTTAECDIFEQDCPEGEKCMPWSNDGGGGWNATRCTPIDDDPGEPGDSCTVEGSGTSGIDDCTLGAMCWDVDVETNVGTCVAMCMGDESNPLCEDPDTTCAISNDGVLALCLTVCDPLLQDCDPSQACYPVDDAFVCAPDASGEMGAYGDPCEYINVCDPGLLCLPPESTPGCMNAGCCTEFCSLSDAMGDDQCTGAAQGQQCIPFFEEGSTPPQYIDIGVCSLPP